MLQPPEDVCVGLRPARLGTTSLATEIVDGVDCIECTLQIYRTLIHATRRRTFVSSRKSIDSQKSIVIPGNCHIL
jgi:hypothetical protein